MICFCHVLTKRVKLKDYIGRICFRCKLLPVLLIQEKPIAKFAIMQS